VASPSKALKAAHSRGSTWRSPWYAGAVRVLSGKTLALLGASVGVLWVSSVHAEAPASVEPVSSEGTSNASFTRTSRGYMAIDRPVGIAEFGLGAFTLPGAEICGPGSCSQGDVSFELDAWQLYRPTLRYSFGAGITMGLLTIRSPGSEDPAAFARDHSRGYLTVEAIGRYYAYVGETVEAWAGLTSGLAVVRDSFSDKQSTELSLVRPRGAPIRSEGLALGFALGSTFALSPNWSVVGSARYGAWFLPTKPATDPFGDKASLTGQTNVVALSLGVGYRIPL